MVFLMVNEAARCLEEQIVTDPADVDFAMIMGTGFAPFRGGPLRYADTVGAARLVGAMNHLVDFRSGAFRAVRAAGDNGRRTAKNFIQKTDAIMNNIQTPPEEQRPLIDTSKMSAGQRAAMELTEAARESGHARTFAGGMFMGEFNLSDGASISDSKRRRPRSRRRVSQTTGSAAARKS